MTPQHTMLVFLLALTGTGCSTEHFIEPPIEKFEVTSIPAGADVKVMGTSVGTTPLKVGRNQVFPVTYARELEPHYGRIELTHTGCKPLTVTVSNAILGQGLHAQLECEVPAPAVTGNIRERLLQLKALRDDGLITDEEYSRKRQSLLDNL